MRSFFNLRSANAQNGKNRSAIFTILCHLRRAKRGVNGYIELTFFYTKISDRTSAITSPMRLVTKP